MHMPRLTMVPCVPRTCPDVEPVSGTNEMLAIVRAPGRLLAGGSTVPPTSAATTLQSTTDLG